MKLNTANSSSSLHDIGGWLELAGIACGSKTYN